MAAKLASAVRVGKHALHDQIEMPVEQSYAPAAPVIAESVLDPDLAEGVRAFLEKRPPDWPR